ncbi:hypothetical protein [Seonamhaeicola marinus]|uniref:DUF4468 domain-containing protein n=1 Tax=Seonamhaeicola marinus TaxID=1912246 RepID=A0A5D0HSC9_9FLAO|nr:hypothetical protein [Seonamhaeicola marinus]TYA74254.1 hypothetical protein FUA24_13050 [Seonamhaeicola marinus]
MKPSYFLFLFVLNLNLLVAQSSVIPIKIETQERYILYKASGYDEMIQKIKDMDYWDKRKISESYTKAVWRSENGFNTAFYKSVLSKENYDYLKKNRSRKTLFYIYYVIDHTGDKTYSVALKFPKNLIELSEKEVQAILSEAMEHTFKYEKRPKVDNFFFKVGYALAI